MMVLQPRDRGGGAIGSRSSRLTSKQRVGRASAGALVTRVVMAFALKNSVSFVVVIAHSVFVAVTLVTVVVAGGGQVSAIRRCWDRRN
jgi:hypothetical protein